MIGTIAVLLFFGLDIALVVAAMLWMSEKRAEKDKNDTRYRDKRNTIKYR